MNEGERSASFCKFLSKYFSPSIFEWWNAVLWIFEVKFYDIWRVECKVFTHFLTQTRIYRENHKILKIFSTNEEVFLQFSNEENKIARTRNQVTKKLQYFDHHDYWNSPILSITYGDEIHRDFIELECENVFDENFSK